MRLRRNSTSGGLLSEGARSSVRSVAQVLLGSSRFSIPMSPTCWGGLSRELPLLVGSVARWVSVLSSRYLVLRAVDPGPFCGHDVIDASFAGGSHDVRSGPCASQANRAIHHSQGAQSTCVSASLVPCPRDMRKTIMCWPGRARHMRI